MTIRCNADRARLLRTRGYTVTEIAEAMNEEGRDVHAAEVTAWLAYKCPPDLYEFEGKRRPLSEIAAMVGLRKSFLAMRMQRGMSLIDAITRPLADSKQAARAAKSPWRGAAVCGGRA